MKERPILFQGAMVRALLAGTKTQTRRAIKLQTGRTFDEHALQGAIQEWRPVFDKVAQANVGDYAALIRCPYGQPGDHLWVREAHLNWWKLNADGTGREFSHVAAFAADGYQLEPGEKWIPSIHMLRAASRILLEITEVRVQRLQEISEEDCWAEGIEEVMHEFDDLSQCMAAKRIGSCIDDAKPLYMQLWERINGAGSWDSNCWVWAVSFKRVQP